MSIEPFIGTKISLISKVGIRYEGSLHSLNTDDSTIVLNDVRCMGTEGRSKGHEVPPSSKVHDFVVFRGEDVSDIVVNDSKPQIEDPAYEDPAIFKTYKRDEYQTTVSTLSNDHAKKPTKQPDVGIANIHKERQPYHERQERPSRRSEKDLNKGKVAEKNLETFQFDTVETKPADNYTFTKEAGFKKNDDGEELHKSDQLEQLQDSKDEPKVFYDKKSFYDNLSHEKKLSKNDLREENLKQREIDIATFGKMSISNWHHRNNSYRGRRFNNSNRFKVKAGWERNSYGNHANNEKTKFNNENKTD
ncbi:hypothetical protein MACJ_001294 [Theileria orientalis]|uniref:FFD box profile domain-containing protein n=1 Tax=Theileria orientalis TaxID=68886 RepID=A0A976M8A2_THEOR|nr:hypothetical protein MACJ_001294 [Theileria orientalis]